MRDYGHLDPDDGGVMPVVLFLIAIAIVVAIVRAPGPEDVRTHVETDAIRQVQIERERNRRYAATRKLDSLEAALSDCRMERAVLEVRE